MLGTPGKRGRVDGFVKPPGRFPDAIIGCGSETGMGGGTPGMLADDEKIDSL